MPVTTDPASAGVTSWMVLSARNEVQAGPAWGNASAELTIQGPGAGQGADSKPPCVIRFAETAVARENITVSRGAMVMIWRGNGFGMDTHG